MVHIFTRGSYRKPNRGVLHKVSSDTMHTLALYYRCAIMMWGLYRACGRPPQRLAIDGCVFHSCL